MSLFAWNTDVAIDIICVRSHALHLVAVDFQDHQNISAKVWSFNVYNSLDHIHLLSAENICAKARGYIGVQQWSDRLPNNWAIIQTARLPQLPLTIFIQIWLRVFTIIIPLRTNRVPVITIEIDLHFTDSGTDWGQSGPPIFRDNPNGGIYDCVNEVARTVQSQLILLNGEAHTNDNGASESEGEESSNLSTN